MNLMDSERVDALLQEAAGRRQPVFLVGAGGCGMSGVGHLLMDLGFAVAGSDLSAGEEVRQLRRRGALIHTGHEAAQLEAAQPFLVVYSSAIRADNPELRAAVELKVPVVRRATLLAALVHRQRGICVAGMHGKTTTSALLAFTLRRLGAPTSHAVGALVPQLERHAGWTRAADSDPSSRPYFVVETDESDGTFRLFHPEMAVLLNVDAEHLDYFADLEAVGREFQAFARQTRGLLVFCADDARLAEWLAERPGAVSYGFHALAQYRVGALAHESRGEPGARFEIWHDGGRLGEFRIRLAGEKNVSNAAAVVALLHRLGFDPAAIAEAMAPFQGAARRQEELYRDGRFRVFEDYGHHPNEIAATLQAMRRLGARRLLVAFQAHRYTRTQHLMREFGGCFAGADRLWLTEIYGAFETPIPGIDGAALAAAVRASGQAVEYVPDPAALPAVLREAMQPGDLVLILGAGDITHAAHALVAQLKAEPPAAARDWMTELPGRLSPSTVVRVGEPLAKRTTLRVGGKAELYVEPATEAELALVLQFCAERSLPWFLLGRGSNLLVKDGGLRGVVVSLAHPDFSKVEVSGSRLLCGAGARLKTVATEARRAGLGGLEFLEGIPGSVGGALRMNAGAMGSWVFDRVDTVRFMDRAGRVQECPAAAVNVEYRGCPLFKDHIALGAVFIGEPSPREQIEAQLQAFNRKRWDSQPAAPSAGCIFKNPQEIPAGRLIDELGLKGTRVGGAVVSDVHANFIVNDGAASAEDVLNLIALIRQRAWTMRGIRLETEVQIVGD